MSIRAFLLHCFDGSTSWAQVTGHSLGTPNCVPPQFSVNGYLRENLRCLCTRQVEESELWYFLVWPGIALGEGLGQSSWSAMWAGYSAGHVGHARWSGLTGLGARRVGILNEVEESERSTPPFLFNGDHPNFLFHLSYLPPTIYPGQLGRKHVVIRTYFRGHNPSYPRHRSNLNDVRGYGTHEAYLFSTTTPLTCRWIQEDDDRSADSTSQSSSLQSLSSQGDGWYHLHISYLQYHKAGLVILWDLLSFLPSWWTHFDLSMSHSISPFHQHLTLTMLPWLTCSYYDFSAAVLLRSISELQFSQPKQIQPDRSLRFFTVVSLIISTCVIIHHLFVSSSSPSSGVFLDFIGSPSQREWTLVWWSFSAYEVSQLISLQLCLLGTTNRGLRTLALILLDVFSSSSQLLLVLLTFTESHQIPLESFLSFPSSTTLNRDGHIQSCRYPWDLPSQRNTQPMSLPKQTNVVFLPALISPSTGFTQDLADPLTAIDVLEDGSRLPLSQTLISPILISSASSLFTLELRNLFKILFSTHVPSSVNAPSPTISQTSSGPITVERTSLERRAEGSNLEIEQGQDPPANT